MIRKVEVWNDHNRDYSESFDDKTIVVPAKKCIIMEEPDAVRFLGQFSPMKKDAQGRDLMPKMLRMIVTTQSAELTSFSEFKCMMCSKEFKSENELSVHGIEDHKNNLIIDEDKPNLKKKTA